MLRPFRQSDLGEVHAIEQVSQSAPWALEACARLLAQPAVKAMVWEQSDQIRGFVIYMRVGPEFEILDLVTHPGFRRRGIGRQLLAGVLELEAPGLESGYLEVRVSNLAAQGLYTLFGFKTFGRRVRYYSDNGEDALMMRWEK